MKQNGMKKVSQVEQYYVKQTLENVKKLGAKYMIWQDPIDNGVKVSLYFIQEILAIKIMKQ